MKSIWLCVALLAIAPTSAFAANYQWVDGRGQRCDLACEQEDLTAVTSGSYSGNGQQFFVCAGEASGKRPGYNLAPNWSSACFVGNGGREVGAPIYDCLCQ